MGPERADEAVHLTRGREIRAIWAVSRAISAAAGPFRTEIPAGSLPGRPRAAAFSKRLKVFDFHGPVSSVQQNHQSGCVAAEHSTCRQPPSPRRSFWRKAAGTLGALSHRPPLARRRRCPPAFRARRRSPPAAPAARPPPTRFPHVGRKSGQPPRTPPYASAARRRRKTVACPLPPPLSPAHPALQPTRPPLARRRPAPAAAHTPCPPVQPRLRSPRRPRSRPHRPPRSRPRPSPARPPRFVTAARAPRW